MEKDLNRKREGFTLVELLAVVAIIGLLVGMVVISIRSVKAKSRDVERVSEINSIAMVLALYHSDNNLYPIFEGYITGNDDLSLALEATTYIDKIPIDPLGLDSSDCGSLTGYRYYYQSADGRDYILRYCLETDSMLGKTHGENYISP